MSPVTGPIPPPAPLDPVSVSNTVTDDISGYEIRLADGTILNVDLRPGAPPAADQIARQVGAEHEVTGCGDCKFRMDWGYACQLDDSLYLGDFKGGGSPEGCRLRAGPVTVRLKR